MRPGRADQLLSYALRLPDEAQADALRLLDASREVVIAILIALWPALDTFADAHPGPAWKQVDALLSSPASHGSRQWRCEAEVAGRVLRGQAARNQLFPPHYPSPHCRLHSSCRNATESGETPKRHCPSGERTQGSPG